MIALRRKYFHSVEFQGSMHSRTLMVVDVPQKSRSDEGLAQLATRFKPENIRYAQAHIGRDMGELPDLLEQHTKAVKRLEKYLAVYLRNPSKLPDKRPTCKPKGKTQKIDAKSGYGLTLKDELKLLDKPSHPVKQPHTVSSPTPPSPPPISSLKPQKTSTPKEVPST